MVLLGRIIGFLEFKCPGELVEVAVKEPAEFQELETLDLEAQWDYYSSVLVGLDRPGSGSLTGAFGVKQSVTRDCDLPNIKFSH